MTDHFSVKLDCREERQGTSCCGLCYNEATPTEIGRAVQFPPFLKSHTKEGLGLLKMK